MPLWLDHLLWALGLCSEPRIPSETGLGDGGQAEWPSECHWVTDPEPQPGPPDPYLGCSPRQAAFLQGQGWGGCVFSFPQGIGGRLGLCLSLIWFLGGPKPGLFCFRGFGSDIWLWVSPGVSL